MMRYLLVLSVIVSALLPFSLHAEELEMINRPVNTTGLTGLIVTTTPFTLPARTVEIGAMSLSENSLTPDFTADEFPLTLSLGIGKSSELAVRTSYVTTTTGTAGRDRGTGDTELSYKWTFIPQREFSAHPAAALILTGVFPTADQATGMSTVRHWGARVGFSVGSDIEWEDNIIGLYADAQAVVQDLSDEQLRDSSALVNAGILFPISKYRNLQMIVEYNLAAGRRMPGSGTTRYNSVNFSAVTYGLRLVSEQFNLTMGTQFIHKTDEQYDDSSKIIGIMSIKF